MPYKVYPPTATVDERPKDKQCDVRVRVRVAMIQPQDRGRNSRVLAANGTVTFSLGSKEVKATTDENGNATALIRDVEKQQDLHSLLLEATFRAANGETASAELPPRITIPALPRDDRDKKPSRPRFNLRLDHTINQIEDEEFQINLVAMLTKTVHGEKDERKEIKVGNYLINFLTSGTPLENGTLPTGPGGVAEMEVTAESGKFPRQLSFTANATIDGQTVTSNNVKVPIRAKQNNSKSGPDWKFAAVIPRLNAQAEPAG